MANFVLKLLLVGNSTVGKSTLMHRYVEGRFKEDTGMTIGVEFYLKKMEVGENTAILQMFDFAGAERFRFLLSSYFLGAKGALLLFDGSRPETFQDIEGWVSLLREDKKDLPIFLIRTKKDLDREIPNEINLDAIEYAMKKYNL